MLDARFYALPCPHVSGDIMMRNNTDRMIISWPPCLLESELSDSEDQAQGCIDPDASLGLIPSHRDTTTN